MTIDGGLKPEGAPERSPIAGAGAPSGVDAGPKRYSVRRKMAVVARLLRGEPLDVVAREANVRLHRGCPYASCRRRLLQLSVGAQTGESID